MFTTQKVCFTQFWFGLQNAEPKHERGVAISLPLKAVNEKDFKVKIKEDKKWELIFTRTTVNFTEGRNH